MWLILLMSFVWLLSIKNYKIAHSHKKSNLNSFMYVYFAWIDWVWFYTCFNCLFYFCLAISKWKTGPFLQVPATYIELVRGKFVRKKLVRDVGRKEGSNNNLSVSSDGKHFFSWKSRNGIRSGITKWTNIIVYSRGFLNKT